MPADIEREPQFEPLALFGNDFLEKYPDAKIPPPCFIESGATIIAHEQGKSLSVRFTITEKQTGPLGILQGGVLCSLFDDVFGPLSFATAKKPCVSIDMNVNFVRMTKAGESLTIKAEFVSKTRRLLQMKAEANNEKGKLVATCSSNLMVYEA
ncbi:MAG: PaaI family thioesterase [Spirochaetota bacterium]